MSSRKPLRIGLAGLGVVGGAVARALAEDGAFLATQAGRPLQLVAVAARDPHKARPYMPPQDLWIETPQKLADHPSVDVVVELMGGATGAAPALVQACLEKGRPVVTANKALLAAKWHEWHPYQPLLQFEASVCGAIPVIKVLREGLAANRITSVRGILNGTCNYILSEMEAKGLPFDVALKSAQDLGYAEADPTLDIDGYDAAHKLLLLAMLAFDQPVNLDDISITGIRRVDSAMMQAAHASDSVIRLVAEARLNAGVPVMSVAPVMVPLHAFLASVTGALNAIHIEADRAGPISLMGQGAGAVPTSSAVLADLIDLARKMG